MQVISCQETLPHILFSLLGVNEAEFILRVVSSEGHTQSMRSERFYPARAFPFYCELLLTLHDLLNDVNPAGLFLFVTRAGPLEEEEEAVGAIVGSGLFIFCHVTQVFRFS